MSFSDLFNPVLLFAVAGLAFAKGGRYERYFALTILLGFLVGSLLQLVLGDYTPELAFTLLDAGLFAGQGWIAWRCRSAWVLVALTAQGAMVVLDLLQLLTHGAGGTYLDAMLALGDVQMACVAYGVLRRRLGPPFTAAGPAGTEQSAASG